MRKPFITILFLIFTQVLRAQTCTVEGQLPSSAFPVCGTTTFHQTTVPICSTHAFTVPGCTGDGADYGDKNPFWYKFTCYQSGTLGFLITPKDLGDDYDWELFDITGHDPNEVFTNTSLIVAANSAGTYGQTGASSAGVSFIQCASLPSDNKNSFHTMPQLIQGHTYLLMVSHYTPSQSGYDLSFGGGTAVITDPKIPTMTSSDASCSGNTVHLKLNKRIKCTSIEKGGTDFILNYPDPIIGEDGIGCSSSFDTDSLDLHLSNNLPPGTYALVPQIGADGNTLLDYCDNALPTSDTIYFTVYPIVPTPMDSMTPLSCAPGEIHLIFRKPIECSSIAPDGSDFTITGTYPVTIEGASGNCTGGASSSKEIVLTLTQPLQQAGNFTITLKQGSDGNTLLDECGQQTLPGSSLLFGVKDTVNAEFSFAKKYGCSTDTIDLYNQGGNGINYWYWDLADGQTSTLQNPEGLYYQFNSKTISLIVSNGFCSDTATQAVDLDNYLKADFTVDPDECPKDPVAFTSTAQGHIVTYNWAFGDGGTSTETSPTHSYSAPTISRPFTVQFTITDSLGCTSTAGKPIMIYSSCYIAVPTAFTPNNDGKNDLLHPLNAIKADQLDFKVFNRWGQLVYETHDWKQGWDGTINGQPQGSGVYVWFLQYIDKDTHKMRQMKGTAALIR